MSDNQEATFHGKQESIAELMEATGELHSLTVLPETVGDWAGHTSNVGPITNVDGDRHRINAGIRSLVTISGENSRDHGFHDDWPTDEIAGASSDPAVVRAVGLAITEKLALIHEEVSEALGEIRSGEDPLESYFVDKKGLIGTAGERYSRQYYGNGHNHPDEAPRPGDVPLLKPEGFIVELADAMIRIADLTYLVGGRFELVKALEIKHEYNATRPYKHGRKF